MRCGSIHPSKPEVACTIKLDTDSNHPDHYDRKANVDWPNLDWVPDRKVVHVNKRAAIQVAADAAKATGQPDRVGRPPTPAEHLAEQRPVQADVPAEAVQAWSRDDWVEGAYTVLVGWIRSHPGQQFTTPEDIWPLLTAPREMRAMVLPVRRAIKHGLMAEVGAKRLRETYRTRDGVEFPMNKLVPIYRGTQ